MLSVIFVLRGIVCIVDVYFVVFCRLCLCFDLLLMESLRVGGVLTYGYACDLFLYVLLFPLIFCT